MEEKIYETILKKDGREMTKNELDVAIIGAGPAGLGAAIYAERAGLNMAVFDKSPISGGQILSTYEVDNYLGFTSISGSDLGMKFREHADALRVPFINEEVLCVQIEDNRKKIVTDANEYEAKVIIVATGATHSKLWIKGEEELSGMGVSYCATCDGAFFRNRTVAVVGGGNVAVEDAIFLAGLCKKVYLIHRRDELRAAKSLQNKLFSMENVECIWDTTVSEIIGEEQVDALAIKNVKTEEMKKLSVDGIFIAVGIVPETEMFRNIFEMDEKGYVIAGENCATSCPGIYAVGDIRRKELRQIITAVADGANAVNHACAYLRNI